MCRMLHGDEVTYQLADGEAFILSKPGGSGPDTMRFITLSDSTGKLLFGYSGLLSIGPVHTMAVRFH